jgi:PAS domain-containing protein
LSDQAEHGVPALPKGVIGRVVNAVIRGFRELYTRLWTSLWQIVAVGVIMVSLVLIAGLSKAFALIAFTSFVASVLLLPRHDAEPAQEPDAKRPASSGRSAAAMNVMAEALPDPVILLDQAGQVLFCNAPARGLFASLRQDRKSTRLNSSH